MNYFLRDTSPEALAVFYEIQRRRAPEQKSADVFDLSQGLFELVKTGIRTRHPAADEREVCATPPCCYSMRSTGLASLHHRRQFRQFISRSCPGHRVRDLYQAVSPLFY